MLKVLLAFHHEPENLNIEGKAAGLDFLRWPRPERLLLGVAVRPSGDCVRQRDLCDQLLVVVDLRNLLLGQSNWHRRATFVAPPQSASVRAAAWKPFGRF